MVYQVCRRTLPAPADAEDAFQATFLVLARRAGAIRRHESLAAWLHGVARRTALKLRAEADRRRTREEAAARSTLPGVRDDTPWGELRSVLDEELGRLPAGCRAALVLCYLEGRTQDEAAAQLGVCDRTVRRQLDRGRQTIARRLARRGLTLGGVLAARLFSDCAQAALPPALLARTAALASRFRVGLATPAGVVPARVATLTEGVTKAMQYATYKSVVAVLACSLGLGFGLSQLGPRPASAQDRPTAAAAKPPARAPDIEPIDPKLVFYAEVQKELRLSPNQVRQLTDARQKGTRAAADQGQRVADIDRRIQELEEEITRLRTDRDAADLAIQKAEAEQVRAVIPQVLSREATDRLRQMTLQRMRLSDALLNPKVRGRLGLDDEQVKKIQELADSGRGATRLSRTMRAEVLTHRQVVEYLPVKRTLIGLDTRLDATRSDLLKVLTPEQRKILERLAGVPAEKGKE
jgi:RNA polymerase sigma factor (sigma-70 family)